MACLPCLILPALAASSAGVGTVADKKRKTTIMWISIAATILFLGLWIFWIVRKKAGKCSTCTYGKK